MGDRFFEDFAPGTRFESAAITVTEVEIVEFARRYDPQFFHTDPAAARESAYGGLIASGFHTAALTFGLFLETGAFGTPDRTCSLGAHGLDELRWLLPVRPGDTLRVVAEVAEARPSGSKPDRGVVRLKYTTLNQRDEAVMTMFGIQILKRRPTNAGDRG